MGYYYGTDGCAVVGFGVGAELLCPACAEDWASRSRVDLDDPDACAVASVAPLFALDCDGHEALYCDWCLTVIWEPFVDDDE